MRPTGEQGAPTSHLNPHAEIFTPHARHLQLAQPSDDDDSNSYSPQSNPYLEHPQHAPQMSSQSNQYNGHLPYGPSTRKAESAWQQPQSSALAPSLATYDHPTLPSNSFNSSYMHAEQTASAPSDVLARMSGPQISNVHDSDYSWGLFNIQDHDHQRPTMTDTMTGHYNGHATPLQQQYHYDEHATLLQQQYELQLLQCKVNDYRCDLCPRRFKDDHGLIEHQEIDHLVGPKMCGSCGYKFSRRDHLEVRFSTRRFGICVTYTFRSSTSILQANAMQETGMHMLIRAILLHPSSWVSWHSSLGTPRRRCGACGDRIWLWHISISSGNEQDGPFLALLCFANIILLFLCFIFFVRGRIP